MRDYWRLVIRCPCGGMIQDTLVFLAITANSQLAFAGVCPVCRLRVMTCTSLQQLLDDSKTIVPSTQFTDEDVKLLRSLEAAFSKETS